MVITEALQIVLACLRTQYPGADLQETCSELKKITLAEGADASQGDHMSCGYMAAQEKLSKLNEKETIRKAKGVYYTPGDVVSFILKNSIKAACGQLKPDQIGEPAMDAVDYVQFCVNKTVFDPTCGAGEFLLAALELKFDLMDRQTPQRSHQQIQALAATIRGNDVNRDSVVITKLRLFLCTVHRYGLACGAGLADILNGSFQCCDYISKTPSPGERYDIILGNPPYVEDSKSNLKLEEKYGNIYANVLVNAAKQLNPGGSIGFVVPLSYISTPRMKKLRAALRTLVPEQYILSYADRPDCLFGSVHQKLCIVIGRSGAAVPAVYTGNYQYWYKQERSGLFQRTAVIENTFAAEDFIPKLGTVMDAAIYRKVTDREKLASVYALSREGGESVYLNRRETFWMKAYREPVKDPEYKVFSYHTPAEADYCYCLINSSLFWWYWICTSDCWHVSKELNGFLAPQNPDGAQATRLADQLRKRLEETKVYVGTVQTEYEYKHRDCLPQIYAIDDFVNGLYGLTPEESSYIKKFAMKYRTSGGAEVEGN